MRERTMEIGRPDEIEDSSPPTLGSLQIAGSPEFMSQAYSINSSHIDIEDASSFEKKDCPLPVYLKVYHFHLAA